MAALHPPVEEYLRAVHELEEEGTEAIQARLAERLHLSAPSVSEMVRRLERDGYVDLLPDRRIRLTGTGREYAEKIVRRHRLAERLLIDILGLDWALAHIEAEKFEHVISEAVEERIIAILGGPTTCPHGNPIPGLHPGGPDPTQPLSATAPGDELFLRRLTEDVEIDFPSLRYLGDTGFIPGQAARVLAVAPDGGVTVEVGGSPVAIGPWLARHLFVEVAAPGQAIPA